MTLQATEAVAGEPSEKPSRTQRYEKRLLAELASLSSDGERARFLSKELVRWITRHEQFAADVASGRDFGPDGPTAFDYAATIAAIGALKSKYERTCDCCDQRFPRDEVERCWAPGGIETFACEACRGMP